MKREKYLCIPRRWEHCSDTLTPYLHTPHTTRPDLCSSLPTPHVSSAPEAVPPLQAPEPGPRSVARGWDHRDPPGNEDCSGTEDGRAARRKKRRREKRWRRAWSHRGRRASWQGCTVAGCKGAAGGQGPAGGSPEGQPACLKWKKMEVQGQKLVLIVF